MVLYVLKYFLGKSATELNLIFFVIWGYHDQHSITQKVYEIEIYFLQFRKAE